MSQPADNDSEVAVSFPLEPREFAPVVRYLLLASHSVLRTLAWGLLVVSLLLLAVDVLVAVLLPRGLTRGLSGDLSLAAIVLVSTFLWWAIPAVGSQRIVRGLGSPVRVTFGVNGIVSSTPRIESRTEWSIYREAKSVGPFYVLMDGLTILLVVKASAFASATEDRRFRELVQEHLGIALRPLVRGKPDR